MRLFSAIATPDEIAHELELFRGGLPEARWVDPADFHVTLGFFGEIDRHVADELAQALSEIDMPPVDLQLTGLGVFGAERPHAIVALAERTPALLSLEAAHRAIMQRLGIGDQVRKYTPHVTLGRMRRVTAGEVAAWMSQQPAFRPLGWRADRFAVYSSRTSRGGGPYVAEVTFRLEDGRTPPPRPVLPEEGL